MAKRTAMLAVTLEPELKQRLQRAAEEEGRTMSGYVQRMLWTTLKPASDKQEGAMAQAVGTAAPA